VKNGTLVGADIAKKAIGGTRIQTNSVTTANLAGVDANGQISLSGIPNGRCTQVTLGVGGALKGDIPFVTPAAPLQNGIVLYAESVPSDGHMIMDACNFSGTTMTPISAFPIRMTTFR
jgi:hypothetical protein